MTPPGSGGAAAGVGDVGSAGGAGGEAPVPSPCIDVCRMDAASGLCEGCLRSLDEIAAWSRMSGAGKRAVWAALEVRRAARARAAAPAAPAPPAPSSGTTP